MTRNQLFALAVAVIVVPILILVFMAFSSATRTLTHEIVELNEKGFEVRITNTSTTKKFEGYVIVQEGTASFKRPLVVEPENTIHMRLPRPNLRRSDPPPRLRMWFEYQDLPGR